MKCTDCKNYSNVKGKDYWCSWHAAALHPDLVELDSAEKDCVGFERKA